MLKINLKEKYPNILEQTKAWDCGFTEAIERINNLEGLNKWIGDAKTKENNKNGQL